MNVESLTARQVMSRVLVAVRPEEQSGRHVRALPNRGRRLRMFRYEPIRPQVREA